MPEPTDDPRRRGFSSPVRAGEESRRGIALPPPPKPTVTLVEDDPAEAVDSTDDTATAPQEPAAAGPARPNPKRPARQAEGSRSAPVQPGTSRLGTQRHRLRYVQIQLTSEMSERLTTRAQTEGVVLGEVVMDAVRAYGPQPVDDPRRKRRQESVAVRRSVLLRPEEANLIAEVAEQCGETPSALIRRCLERHLAPSGASPPTAGGS